MYLFARLSLFIIFFWFGLLKVVGVSPAESFVLELFQVTLSSWMSFETFLPLFGLFEMLIGCTFLFKKTSKLALGLILFHMALVFSTSFLLPSTFWQAPLVPTLIGQYVIKNLSLIALAWLISKE